MRTRWLKNLSVIKPCWFCLLIPPSARTADLDQSLRGLGYVEVRGDGGVCYALKTFDSWHLAWEKAAEMIERFDLGQISHAAIVPGEECPTFAEAALQQSELSEMAESSLQMWLLESIENGALMCHFIPVVDIRGEVFGYESLVRIQREDGTLARGGDIFKASRILRIEHVIDRHLHELSIRSFAAQGLQGFLFINVLPGFIQRPDVYLGGLGDACGQVGMDKKRVVLDCTNSENPRDVLHLKAIHGFCRSEGYLFSLDDIESLSSVTRIFNEMKPDFIKLDMRLVHRIHEQEALLTINRLVEYTRASTCTLIAEGVEEKNVEETLARAGVSLFQGYLYSAHDRIVGENAPPQEAPAVPKPASRRKPA